MPLLTPVSLTPVRPDIADAATAGDGYAVHGQRSGGNIRRAHFAELQCAAGNQQARRAVAGQVATIAVTEPVG